MEYKNLAIEILNLLGGKENIDTNTICMTRLRIKVINNENISLDNIKKLNGVLGVVNGINNEIQIVLGPGKVKKIGEEFSKITEKSLNDVNTIKEAEKNKNANVDKNVENNIIKILKKISQKVANIFIPIIPLIIISCIINGISINLMYSGNGNIELYEKINLLSLVIFNFLNIFICMNTVKEFGGSGILGGIIGIFFISNNGELIKEILFINSYNNILNENLYDKLNNNSVISVLIMGIIIAYIEKIIRKIVPNILDNYLTPLLTFIISISLGIVIIQPFSQIITIILMQSLEILYSKMGLFGGFVIASLFLSLVSTGIHHLLLPIHLILNNSQLMLNGGLNYYLPLLMMAGAGQIGGAAGLYIKSKDNDLKNIIKKSIFPGILGMGEPLMYSVVLPRKKVFIASSLGAGIGGIFCMYFNISTISLGLSGILGILIIEPGKQIEYVISLFGAFIGGLLFSYFISE